MQKNDAFHSRALGKTSALIYETLKGGPLSAMDLHEKTGKSLSTIYRLLHKMAHIKDEASGEVYPMVVERDGLWIRQEVYLTDIARALGTEGAGQRKIEQHKKDREALKRRFPNIAQKRNKKPDVSKKRGRPEFYVNRWKK